MEIIKKRKDSSNILIILCFIVYTFAYLGKYSYSANIVEIIDYYNVTKADAGLISTVFFITYGIGQVVNGILSKRYPKRFTISLVLLVSSIINLLLFFNIPFNIIKYLWFINAIAESVIWPVIISVLSDNLPDGKLKTAVLWMSITVASGTIISYSLSSLFIKLGIFKMTFMIASVSLIIISLIWLLSYNKIVNGIEQSSSEKEEEKTQESNDISRYIGKYIIPTIIVLGLFAIVNNLVKDGLNTWVPNILKEVYGLENSLSVLLTMTLSILGMFGSMFALFLNKKIKNFTLLSGVLFLFSSIQIMLVIILLKTNMWYLVIVLFGLVSLLMHGINNCITSMAPLFLRRRINSGLLAGVLNGACYIGSALSAYVLGIIADNRGWNFVFYLLLSLTVFAVILGLVSFIVNRDKKETK